MSDLTRWELRGPVRTVQTRSAGWNPEAEEWWPLNTRFVAMFRPDGQLNEIEHHNADGSTPREVRVYDAHGRLMEEQRWAGDVLTGRVLHAYDGSGRPASLARVDVHGTRREAELCRYDDRGRKTRVVFLSVPESSAASCSTASGGMLCGVEGTDTAYSAPGATTRTTIYDERELPSEVTFHDANGALVCRVVFFRDQDGRMQSERMQFERLAEFFGTATNVPADERESLAELLATVFDDHTLLQTTYAHDEKGRRIECVRRMGQLSEERTTVRYDDYDNPVEQVTVDHRRDMRIDDGAVKIEETPGDAQYVRFEYQYDVYGNWVERVVWQRTKPNTDERRSNVERRTIAYYEGN